MRIPLRMLLPLIAAATLQTAAQEPAFMEAATHPGREQLYMRSLFFYEKGEVENRSYRTGSLQLKAAYGLTARTALLVDGGYGVRSRSGDPQEQGLESSLIRIKQRIHQLDFSPLNTWRTSLNAGVLLPGDGPAAGLRRLF